MCNFERIDSGGLRIPMMWNSSRRTISCSSEVLSVDDRCVRVRNASASTELPSLAFWTDGVVQCELQPQTLWFAISWRFNTVIKTRFWNILLSWKPHLTRPMRMSKTFVKSLSPSELNSTITGRLTPNYPILMNVCYCTDLGKYYIQIATVTPI